MKLYSIITHDLKNFSILFLLSTSCITPLTSQSESDSIRLIVYDDAPLFIKYEMPIVGYSYTDKVINQKLLESIRYHKKAESKILVGSLLTIAGGVFIVAGVVEDSKAADPVIPGDDYWNFELDFGTAPFFVPAGILLSTSVPFWISSINNKRKMKKSMENARILLIH